MAIQDIFVPDIGNFDSVDVIERLVCDHQVEFARAIEAKLMEKNA